MRLREEAGGSKSDLYVFFQKPHCSLNISLVRSSVLLDNNRIISEFLPSETNRTNSALRKTQKHWATASKDGQDQPNGRLR
jgi:hypothetical protein